MTWLRRIGGACVAGLALAPAFLACGSLPAAEPCEQIPAGGCPASRGGSCADKTCLVIYACIDKQWLLYDRCPDNPGPPVPEAGPDVCTPVAFDPKLQGTGCSPDLQNPDCPSEAAEGCAETACLTGCIDFFQCRATGWKDVAYCDDQGQLIIQTVP